MSARGAMFGAVFFLMGAAAPHRLADSLQVKLDRLRANAARVTPDPAPTVATEDEIDDYFAAGRVALPKGLSGVSFAASNGKVTALATVDFDVLCAPAADAEDRYAGTRPVRVELDARGSGGEGVVRVLAASVDGAAVPADRLEGVVARCLKPHGRGPGLETRFRLPLRVDSAVVGYHKLKLSQR